MAISKLRLSLCLLLLSASGLAMAEGSLRVMTFNIGLGASRTFMPQLIATNQAVAPLASYLARAAGDGPSVVCLQEVDHGRARSGGATVDQLVSALNAAGAPGWQGHYYPLSEFGADGSTGIAVLSRLPGEAEVQRWQIFDGGEDRGALGLKLDFGGEPVWVVNTHLGFSDQPGQVQALIEGIEQHAEHAPVVLCGDLNVADPAVGDNPALKPAFDLTLGPLLELGFVSATVSPIPTYPAWAKTQGMKLDYLMLRADAGLKAVETPLADPARGRHWLSDHRPLAVDLARAPRVPVAAE